MGQADDKAGRPFRGSAGDRGVRGDLARRRRAEQAEAPERRAQVAAARHQPAEAEAAQHRLPLPVLSRRRRQ